MLFQYLGSVQIVESLTKKKPEERDNWTRHCMYRICHQLGICKESSKPEERLLDKLGEVKIEHKDVELNVALHAFIILDKDGVRILERHPIHVISYASSGTEESIKGVFCFVSHVRELGRRCLVFMEPDKNVDFIMETILQIFRLNNKGHGSKLNTIAVTTPETSSNSDDHIYINVCSVPAALGLDRQPWYHGEMERATAESMLRYEGDFLVRISPNTANNFVLSGIANSVAKHFLLLDENDKKVRKQQQVFETVVELIEYHRGENVPIISEGSELHLIRPIMRFAGPLPRR
uniref:SH2 domain-containing protein n=1 Tax=Setaria digitata TaxID=48799 RepID=A0A915PXA0_9BILA